MYLSGVIAENSDLRIGNINDKAYPNLVVCISRLCHCVLSALFNKSALGGGWFRLSDGLFCMTEINFLHFPFERCKRI